MQSPLLVRSHVLHFVIFFATLVQSGVVSLEAVCFAAVHFLYIAHIGRMQARGLLTLIFGCQAQAIIVGPDQACTISCI